MLSSDAGDTVFPNSVESMRQLSGYMQAFGLTRAEVETVTIVNPGNLLKANVDEALKMAHEGPAIGN